MFKTENLLKVATGLDMVNPFQICRRFFQETVWQSDPPERFSQFCRQSLQILILAWKDLFFKGALLRTSALAYASVLTIIPMLALVFAIFKGFGLQRLLAAHLLPQLAGGSQDFARQIISYVEATNVASLGVFGLIWLLVALIILMTNIEQAFNHIWQISRGRPWWRKLSDYLSIFLLFPILMAVAISFTTIFQSHPEIQKYLRYFFPESVFSAYNFLFSLGIIWFGFSFVYLVMPNTRVRLLSGLLGGFIGGTIWQAAQWFFHWFQSTAPYYNAIYGALYQILFLVIWFFWSWLIVLYGAEIAYVHQNLASLRQQVQCRENDADGLADEYLALVALLVIGERFYAGGGPLAQKELVGIFNGQERLAAGSLEALQRCGLVTTVVATDASQPAPSFMPSRPLEQIRLQDALACLKQGRRLTIGRLLGGTAHFSALVGQLLEQPASGWQELTILDFLHKSGLPNSQPALPKCKPTQV